VEPLVAELPLAVEPVPVAAVPVPAVPLVEPVAVEPVAVEPVAVEPVPLAVPVALPEPAGEMLAFVRMKPPRGADEAAVLPAVPDVPAVPDADPIPPLVKQPVTVTV
jgi:hypothetical protein